MEILRFSFVQYIIIFCLNDIMVYCTKLYVIFIFTIMFTTDFYC